MKDGKPCDHITHHTVDSKSGRAGEGTLEYPISPVWVWENPAVADLPWIIGTPCLTSHQDHCLALSFHLPGYTLCCQPVKMRCCRERSWLTAASAAALPSSSGWCRLRSGFSHSQAAGVGFGRGLLGEEQPLSRDPAESGLSPAHHLQENSDRMTPFKP